MVVMAWWIHSERRRGGVVGVSSPGMLLWLFVAILMVVLLQNYLMIII